MKSIRYTTLLKTCGPLIDGRTLTKPQYQKALRENRVITVHHRENNWCDPDWAEVGHHIVNVCDRLVFTKPIPLPDETLVLGVRRHLRMIAGGRLVPHS